MKAILFLVSGALAAPSIPAWFDSRFCKVTPVGFSCSPMPLITQNDMCLRGRISGRYIKYFATDCRFGRNSLFSIESTGNSFTISDTATGRLKLNETSGELYNFQKNNLEMAKLATFAVLPGGRLFKSGAAIATGSSSSMTGIVGLQNGQLYSSSNTNCVMFRMSSSLPAPNWDASLAAKCLGATTGPSKSTVASP